MSAPQSPPPHASRHCRHYSFARDYPSDFGPRCAVGVDLSVGGFRQCLPDPPEQGERCDLREEHTADERAAWEVYSYRQIERDLSVIAVLPSLCEGQTATIQCPACGNKLTYHRGRRRAYITCATPDCVGFQAALPSSKEPWPLRSGEPA